MFETVLDRSVTLVRDKNIGVHVKNEKRSSVVLEYRQYHSGHDRTSCQEKLVRKEKAEGSSGSKDHDCQRKVVNEQLRRSVGYVL